MRLSEPKLKTYSVGAKLSCYLMVMFIEFQAILNGFLGDFPQAVRACVAPIVGAASEIYSRMSSDFLPTPAKSHYVFNLRDLSKCVQGMCRGLISLSFW